MGGGCRKWRGVAGQVCHQGVHSPLQPPHSPSLQLGNCRMGAKNRQMVGVHGNWLGCRCLPLLRLLRLLCLLCLLLLCLLG